MYKTSAVVDLIEDWSTKSRPDIYHFVPYTWHLDVVLKEFELMTLTNEWNWIDCFGQTPENGRNLLAFIKLFSNSVLFLSRCLHVVSIDVGAMSIYVHMF